MGFGKEADVPNEIVIKFSYPSNWDKDWGMPMFLVESFNRKGIWGNCRFEINNDTRVCDFWVVYEDIDSYLFEVADCPKDRCIFITGEEKSMWNYAPEYLDQFGIIFTSRDDIEHPNVIKGQYICPWHVKKDYDALKSSKLAHKKNELSVICSNAAKLEGHKKRLSFVGQLKEHFKDQLHWYGKGATYIEDKWEGLSTYKYSVAIENSSHPNYWTEKIADCFLSYTMPVYWGCPNISDYFPNESFIAIDIEDLRGSVRKIEQAIEGEFYEKHLDAIVKARSLVLDKYQMFPVVSSLVQKLHGEVSRETGKTLIKGKQYFNDRFTLKQQMYIYKRKFELLWRGYK